MEQEGYTVESYVYKRHKIDSTQFALSNDYYSYDLETYNEIYKQVEDSLTKLKEFYEYKRDSIMGGRKKEKKKDSVTTRPQRMFKDSLRQKRDSLILDSGVIPQID